MSNIPKWAAAAVVGFAGAAQAQTDVPAGLHNTSENWTLAGSPYRLKGQVYFTTGTTLTIDAGVVVASLPLDQGSLAICRGAQIFVNGTAADPVIFTSTNDTNTWIGGDPETGIYREACLEWGNLTIMGEGYVSENAIGTNSAFPAATNVANMEGLNTGPATDRYGGGDDNDDSGSISYASFRYGGKVVGLTNELNGLSLGGIGRDTDINFVEVINNVDDGIEIWGGTVNLKNFVVWNVGDDSVDVDQGWRGKAQFGLIVQGHSANDVQGSGVGDNCFEADGAEQSDYQPVTTATIYNCTVIGQPTDGDHGMAYRDNARVQYRNCIFMDLGERLVSFDNVDGDGGAGYGIAGTLSWANTWTTAYNAVPAHGNDFTTGSYAINYPAQTSGFLCEVTDSVFFRNLFATAYTEATARGVLPANGTNDNELILGSADVDSPIVSLTRGQQIIRGGKIIKPVTGLDPRPANEALTSVSSAPADGFFTAANYRGAFEPTVTPWLAGWSAVDAYGFLNKPGTSTSNYCTAGTTSNGCLPSIYGIGAASASAATDFSIVTLGIEINKQGLIFYGLSGTSSAPWGTGSSYLCVKAPSQRTPVQDSSAHLVGTPPSQVAIACTGEFNVDWNNYQATHPGALGQPFSSGNVVYAQAWFRDPPASKTTNLSNGLQFVIDP